jgi:hypothetical protein
VYDVVVPVIPSPLLWVHENIDNKRKKHREAKQCFMLLVHLVVLPEEVLPVSPEVESAQFAVH